MTYVICLYPCPYLILSARTCHKHPDKQMQAGAFHGTCSCVGTGLTRMSILYTLRIDPVLPQEQVFPMRENEELSACLACCSVGRRPPINQSVTIPEDVPLWSWSNYFRCSSTPFRCPGSCERFVPCGFDHIPSAANAPGAGCHFLSVSHALCHA